MYGHRRVSGDDKIVCGFGVEVDRLGRGQKVAQAVGQTRSPQHMQAIQTEELYFKRRTQHLKYTQNNNKADTLMCDKEETYLHGGGEDGHRRQAGPGHSEVHACHPILARD